MKLVCVAALAMGCSFDLPSQLPVTADAVPDSDNPSGPFVALHVPADGQAPGTGDLDLAQVVDTTALTIGGSSSMPAGVAFDMWPQPGGVDLAVLHVRRLHVPAGTTVRVTGRRALVVIASDTIDIEGLLDGSAHRSEPGPGGGAPSQGPGAGKPGAHAGNYRDAGGSGGGFGGAGGRGGSPGGSAGGAGCTVLQGPDGGTAYGDRTLTVLLAGSGGGAVNANGGATPSCGTREAGAGGGAIQLSSATRIRIMGGINVGGGGGGGGRAQKVAQPSCDDTAGAGGGSGGAIFLQAPVIEVPGALAANGGGGGSSGGDANGDDQPPENDGEDGRDGQLSALAAAGGADVGMWSAAGGPGGVTDVGGVGLAETNCDSNGGGGGGGVGRIVVALPAGRTASLGGTVSPMAASTMY